MSVVFNICYNFLKVPISTTPVSTGHVENYSSTLAERFSYKRRSLPLQYGSHQTPSSTQVIVKSARPIENYRNETGLPRESQLRQNKQMIPDDIYLGKISFASTYKVCNNVMSLKIHDYDEKRHRSVY